MPIWDDLQNSIFVNAQHSIGLELMVDGLVVPTEQS
jgi:hypothetical protein